MSPSVSTAKELLARLVAFDTTSSKTSIPLIDFVETYLEGHGIESHRVPTSDSAVNRPFGRPQLPSCA
jgi:acetylornithine deacetylase